MSRYVNTIPCKNVDKDYVAKHISTFMQNEDFKIVDYKGNKIWKKGTGVATAPQYLSITFFDDAIQVEAFLRYALLPGVYVGEMGIDGVFGAIPKAMLKNRVLKVEQMIVHMLNNMPQKV